MKVLFLSVLILGLSNAAAAQSIFIPFEGRREAVKTADFTPKEKRLLKTGNPCGEYFSYEEAADQKILTFKVPISDAESRKGVSGLNRVGLQLLKINIDDALKIPLIEYGKPESDAQTKETERREMFIISLSAQDFRKAACLSGLRPN